MSGDEQRQQEDTAMSDSPVQDACPPAEGENMSQMSLIEPPRRYPRIALQPETRPISLPQLVNEVKGIYVGLVMVETKCIEVDSDRGGSDGNSLAKFSAEQWQALITLHRTLLHEHHDFMLASQHPSANSALRRLAQKYAMPARMWRHGIHSFLELLRHRLPDSQEHMVTFIYLAYSMMALLYETVPAFEDTWVECLGDLSRYRMAIEDENQRIRETWTQVSAGWYTIASNHAPMTGRLYHHLAILARPYVVTQLYLYLKSLCVPVPFVSTRESILTLLDPILNGKPPSGVPEIELDFTKLHAILFTGKFNTLFSSTFTKFIRALNYHIEVTGKPWIEIGVHVAMINSCAALGYGSDDNVLMKLLRQPKTSSTGAPDEANDIEAISSASVEPPSRAQSLSMKVDRVVFSRLGDPFCFGYMHARLVWLVEMAQLPGAMTYLERYIPWLQLVDYLNDSIATYDQYARLESEAIMTAPADSNIGNTDPRLSQESTIANIAGGGTETGEPKTAATPESNIPVVEIALPPRPRSIEDRPIPEDWKLRGMIYTQNTFPKNWFGDVAAVDDGERLMERPAMTPIRKERILWLAVRLARHSKWIVYDSAAHRFSLTAAFEGHDGGTEAPNGDQDDNEDDDINLSDMEAWR